jgi:hypothetical protein
MNVDSTSTVMEKHWYLLCTRNGARNVQNSVTHSDEETGRDVQKKWSCNTYEIESVLFRSYIREYQRKNNAENSVREVKF